MGCVSHREKEMALSELTEWSLPPHGLSAIHFVLCKEPVQVAPPPVIPPLVSKVRFYKDTMFSIEKSGLK